MSNVDEATALCAKMRSQLEQLEHLLKTHDVTIFTSDTIEWQDLSINTQVNMVTFAGKKVPLTKTEWTILRLLAVNRNRWIKHSDIAYAIWGIDIDERGSPENIKGHMVHLRKKLPMRIIETLIGFGYRCYMPDKQEE